MQRISLLMERISLNPAHYVRLPKLSVAPIVAAALFAVTVVAAINIVRPSAESAAPVRVASAQGSAVPADFDQYAAMPRSLELHIANSGFTLLRGARVVEKNDNVVRVMMQWGSQNFTWDARISNGTKFVNSSGEKIDFATIAIGDYVTVSGNLISSDESPTIDAQFIRTSSKSGGKVKI